MVSKSIVIDGQLLRYWEHKAEVPPRGVLLFLHGWRSEARVWGKIISAFPEYDCYAPDLPGFGSSPAPGVPWAMNNYADAIRGFCSSLGLTHLTVVGHSFGGRIGIVLVVQNPSLYRALVLVDSAGIRRESSRTKLLPKLAKLVRPAFRPRFMHSLRKRIYKQIGAEDYVASPELQKTFVNVIKEDLSARLAFVKLPTLIVWGAKDTETPVRDAEQMKKAISGAELVVIPGAEHFSFVDSPEQFESSLKGFLNRIYV